MFEMSKLQVKRNSKANELMYMRDQKNNEGQTGKPRTNMGLIRHFKNLDNFTMYETIEAHDEKGVSKLILANNDTLLVSVGNDGLVCLFEVSLSDAKESEKPSKYSEEILITPYEFEELKTKKELLLSSFQENQFQNSNIITMNERDDKIKYLKDQLVKAEANEKQTISKQIEIKQEYFEKCEARRKKFEQKEAERIAETEHAHSKELAKENRYLEKLKVKHKNAQTEHIEAYKELEESLKKERDDLNRQYEMKLSMKQNEITRLEQVI
jgi:hypothetical protein